MAPECVQVKIEIGHKSICRTEKTKEGFTHDWIIFVRGAEGANISHFVDRVVFYLHESFPKPRRVIKEPPYRVAESGYGSFMLPVEIFFRNKDEPKKVRFEYDLFLQLVGNPPVNNVRVEALTFSDPVEDFKKKLLKAGGVIVPASGLNNPVASPPGVPAVPPITKPEATSTSGVVTDSPSGAVKKPKSSPSVSGGPAQSGPVKTKPKDQATPQNSSLGLKRPSSLDDNASSQKAKKKKLEKSEDPSPKPVPKEISVLSPQMTTTDKDRTKMKMHFSGLKKNKEAKERKKSVDGTATTPVGKVKVVNNGTGKDLAVKESPGKDNKMKDWKPDKQKKDKAQKRGQNDVSTPKTKEESPKVQKLTVKRKSGDAWSSSSTPGSVSTPVGKNSRKDFKLDALMEEFANEISSDDDDEDEDDVLMPFQKKETEPVIQSLSNGDIGHVDQETSSPLQDNKPNTAKTKKGSKGKTIANMKSLSNNNNKVLHMKKNDSSSPQNGKTTEKGLSLKDLHDRICSIEDSEVLQKVVDIVEGTGLFEITDTTFDFDLCMLDQNTIAKLEDSIVSPV